MTVDIWQVRKICVTVFLFFVILYLRAISKYKPTQAFIRRGDLRCFDTSFSETLPIVFNRLKLR